MVGEIMLSGAGLGFILFIVAKMLPNDKLRGMGVSAGKAVSSFGAGKLGSKAWEKIEDFLQNSAGVFFGGFKEGLDADDEVVVVAPKKKKNNA